MPDSFVRLPPSPHTALRPCQFKALKQCWGWDWLMSRSPPTPELKPGSHYMQELGVGVALSLLTALEP